MAIFTDGPNATDYDNSIGPNPLYVLCTTIRGAAVDATSHSIVNEAIIGSDPLALAKLGKQMKTSFAENKIDAELYFRVVQAGF